MTRTGCGVFRKRRPGANPTYFQAEAAGLEWLRDTATCPIPEVLQIGDSELVLERVAGGRASPRAAWRFGAQLAALHDAGASSFGAGPPGAPAAGWIADLPMAYGSFDTFGRMYAEIRVRPYLELVAQGRRFTADERNLFSELTAALLAEDERIVGPATVPSRLHGDLWAGNVLWARDRRGESTAWLIDPAAYGGHRESDLAMLALFGLAYFDEVIDGYEKVHPLDTGWQQRVAIHQLYPLLVHTVLFGGGYWASALAAARAALAAL